MNHILVTGASGTVGRALVQTLTEQGVRFDVMRSQAQAPGSQARVASFMDGQALEAAFAGIDTLFVLLPLVPHKLEMARQVAQAARRAGVSHIVRSSGVGADVSARHSLMKLQGEIDQILLDTGIPTTLLRPAGFMQNLTGSMAAMVRQGQVFSATGHARHSLIDVRDLAAVAAKVLQQPAAHAGRAYTLTGPQALTEAERAAVLSQVLGTRVEHVAVSREDTRRQMAGMGLPAALVDWLDSLNAFVSEGLAEAVSPEASDLLGRPTRSFAQFAEDHRDVWVASREERRETLAT